MQNRHLIILLLTSLLSVYNIIGYANSNNKVTDPYDRQMLGLQLKGTGRTIADVEKTMAETSFIDHTFTVFIIIGASAFMSNVFYWIGFAFYRRFIPTPRPAPVNLKKPIKPSLTINPKKTWYGLRTSNNTIVVLFREIKCNQPGKRERLLFMDAENDTPIWVEFDEWKTSEFFPARYVTDPADKERFQTARNKASDLALLAEIEYSQHQK